MRTKVTLTVLAVVLVFYAGLIGSKGVALVGSGSAVGIVLTLLIMLVTGVQFQLSKRYVFYG